MFPTAIESCWRKGLSNLSKVHLIQWAEFRSFVFCVVLFMAKNYKKQKCKLLHILPPLGPCYTVGWKSHNRRRRCVWRRLGLKPFQCCWTTCTRAGPALVLPGKRCYWTSWAWLTATGSSLWRIPHPTSSAPSCIPTMSVWCLTWPACTLWARSLQPAVPTWTDTHLKC